MKRFYIILLLLVAGHAGFSQRLTLEEAINIALKKSLDIELQKNNVQIADINNHIGVAGGLPTVTANASTNRQLISTNQELNDGENIKVNSRNASNLAANVTAGMLLYNGSRVVATKGRLEELEAQSEKLLNAQVQNTMAAVMTTYFDVVRQQAYIKTISQSIAVAQKRLDIVKAQQSVGMAKDRKSVV